MPQMPIRLTGQCTTPTFDILQPNCESVTTPRNNNSKHKNAVMAVQGLKDLLCDCVGKDAVSVFDDAVVSYILGILEDQATEGLLEESEVIDGISPFLVDAGICQSELEGNGMAAKVLQCMRDAGMVKKRQEQVLAFSQAVSLERAVSKEAALLAARSGKQQVAVNTNDDLTDWEATITQRKKDKKATKKDDKAKQNEYMKYLEQKEAAQKRALENMFVRHGEDGLSIKDIKLENVSITVGHNRLLDRASVQFVYGRRYGLIGRNGSGKTTLLRHIADYELEGVPKGLQILHVEQEVVGDEASVLDTVLAADRERVELLSQEQTFLASSDADSANKLKRVYERMVEIDADGAEARAREILSGLGFDQEMQTGPTKKLSGGWRMRVALARALFISPDVTLLDEPTNHLDQSALIWLEECLKTWKKTLIIVSHARDFLNAVCTDIVHLHSKQLYTYKGDYDSFDAVRREKLLQQQRAHDAQDKHRKHIQSFIDRFRYKAKTARMAQSRIKMLERMDVIPAVLEDPSFAFNLPQPEHINPPILQAVDIAFSYTPDRPPFFKDLNFGVTMESRIALVGPNGAGKSTLLNVLLGELEPTSGLVMRSSKVRFAKFSQHSSESLDMQSSAVENLMATFPNSEVQAIRAHLGSVGITGDTSLQPVYTLSGGQKSRVALAVITYQKPHIIYCDEISNHLDLDTVEALIQAFNQWEGGLVMVSHDAHLINNVCDEIWVCNGSSVDKFNGDYKDYKKTVLKSLNLNFKV